MPPQLRCARVARTTQRTRVGAPVPMLQRRRNTLGVSCVIRGEQLGVYVANAQSPRCENMALP
eukprot:3800466-Lingulodinium_polyedra.AAC.1